MFENATVLPMPEDTRWILRLRQGNHIYLVKEKQFGVVQWEFRTIRMSDPDFGDLGFRKFNGYNWSNETWMVLASGCGVDGRPLILPVSGHLSDAPEKIEQDQLMREVLDLRRRVNTLEKLMWFDAKLTGGKAPFRFPVS